MKIRFLLSFLPLLLLSPLFAQDKTMDSLLTTLKTSRKDTNWVKTMNLLSERAAWHLNDYDTALYYANNAKAYSKKLDFKKGLLRAHNNIAISYHKLDNLPEALKNYQVALSVSKSLGNKKKIAGAYMDIGLMYYEQANYIESLKNNFASLKIYEEIDNKKGIAQASNNIGAIYRLLGHFSEALKYQLAALKIREKLGDISGIAESYSNIGIVYSEYGNSTEALKNYFASLKIHSEIGDRERIADIYNNIAAEYNALSDSIGISKIKRDSLLNQAIRHFFLSLKIYEDIGHKGGMAMAYNNIGGIKIKLNQPKEGRRFFEKGLLLSRELGNIDDIKDSFKGLSAADTLLGNYKRAFHNYKKYIAFRDSIFNEENTKKSVRFEMQYNFAKKSAADSVKVAEEKKIVAVQLKQEKTQRFALYGGLILVVVFAAFMFSRFRVTQRQKNIIELKEKETQQQNEIITIQKNLVEEKHKEITDSINYAERIQRSFLASENLLNQHLKDYFVFFKPKDVVSGDFYWADTLSQNKFVMATADSTGHGVPGAIMSLLNVTSLEKAIEHYTNPAEILNHTRQTIINRLKKDGTVDGGKDGMDCSLLVFDFENNLLQIASAHNPVWVLRPTTNFNKYARKAGDVEITEIKPDKMPVGKHDRDNEPFTLHTVNLQKGDIIYTLTDGFPDQFGGEKGKKFMSKNLRGLLVNNSHLPMLEQKQLLESTFKNWIGDLEQIDDVCVVGIRI
ncbi:MAG: protein serine/threonine phosphatase [Bacteroidota bacterium]|jgi:serine phosphatase RsbU (regulator of sigma subunit)|nr:protein serine/threonine phosphatase [Bacteroidota bacterium]